MFGIFGYGMKKQFVVCLDDSDFEGDLVFGKIYQRLPDKIADQHDQLRVIDESGVAYVYPVWRFGGVEIVPKVKKALTAGFAYR